MTMPGRFSLQKFLYDAVHAECTHVVLEVTSQGIRQFRHENIHFAMAVITNITPEHVEAHGSFEDYRNAKAELFRIAPVHVLNKDDADTFSHFSQIPAKKRIPYSISEFPNNLHLKIPGDFNKENAMAAITVARFLGIDDMVSIKALSGVAYIPGRLEVIQERPFGVVVDYAHTPDALEKVYASFDTEDHRLICVLGATGGGRDVWKRPEHGRIAAEYCSIIFLTDEDSYDEPLEHILKDMEKGLFRASSMKNKKLRYEKISDRKKAIDKAINSAEKGDVVVITGKGSESVIMGPKGTRIPHDDREVARSILAEKASHE
jgi:UDP-N-acetylmuramoyl-L-alanyl-D-glutamate--2,6-diaminopimelate ligase